jgi:hypothetical protein
MEDYTYFARSISLSLSFSLHIFILFLRCKFTHDSADVIWWNQSEANDGLRIEFDQPIKPNSARRIYFLRHTYQFSPGSQGPCANIITGLHFGVR